MMTYETIQCQQGRVTYTPRLLLIDQRSALNHMPVDGALYSRNADPQAINEAEVDTLWDPSRVEVLRDEITQKPEYQQDLDKNSMDTDDKDYNFHENTRSWTDYMYTRYHPRTINVLPMQNSAADEISFDSYAFGAHTWTNKYFDDEFSDRIRQYLEECNNCQGFQALFDCSDAYSGLSMKIFEHLHDEYGKAQFTIPIFAPTQNRYNDANFNQILCDSNRVVNSAMSYANLFEYSSLILPLSTMGQCWRKLDRPRQFSGIEYDPTNWYETSAILATYLDAISLRYRCSEAIDSCHLANFCTDITKNGRALASATMAMPFNMMANQDLIDCLDQTDGFLTALSPHSKIATEYAMQNVSVRGIHEDRLKSSKAQNVIDRQRKMAAHSCSSVSEMFQMYFECSMHCSLSNVVAFEKGMTTKNPFPTRIFGNRYNAIGNAHEFELTEEQKKINKVESIPVLAAAQCTNDLANTIETLHREAKRIKISKLPCCKDADFEADEYAETLEKLISLQGFYDDGFDL